MCGSDSDYIRFRYNGGENSKVPVPGPETMTRTKGVKIARSSETQACLHTS